MPHKKSLKTERTKLRRLPQRGRHDFETIARILDEALFCHVGVIQNGQPYVIPTAFGRDGNRIYLHGSALSRMLTTLAMGVPACVTVTHFDGLVLARSAFHSSVNYRSVMILGRAVMLEGAQKYHGMDVIIDHLIPGRRADLRPITRKEWNATTVLAMPITEASAKIREGGPKDDVEDYALPCWAGVIPFRLTAGDQIPDVHGEHDQRAPDYVTHYRRPGSDQEFD